MQSYQDAPWDKIDPAENNALQSMTRPKSIRGELIVTNEKLAANNSTKCLVKIKQYDISDIYEQAAGE